MTDRGNRVRVFIGSSQEGKEIAENVQLGLHEEFETTLWSQGVFGLSECTLHSLTQKVWGFDCAVLVLTPDDMRQKRARPGNMPRDNVLFELGLFMGALGQQMTFIVHSRDNPPELPTDLAGVTSATFASRGDGNLRAALAPACTQIKTTIRRVLRPQATRPGGAEEFERGGPVARRRRRRSLGVACATAGSRKQYDIANISRSGALLETDGELAVGQPLELDLKLEEGKATRVAAKVVRVQRPDWGRPGGVGVEFTDMEDDTRQALDDYVSQDDVGTAIRLRDWLG